MNTIDFTKQGGFPFDQGVLSFLQDSILLASNTATLGGTTYILKGCEEAGQNIANGVVVINGEMMPFAGGAKQEKVVIVEEPENMNYEDGSSYPSIVRKYATFGDDGVTNLLWADFRRNNAEGVLARLDKLDGVLNRLSTLERVAAPFLAVKDANGVEHRGGMLLWKKPALLIPEGWQEVVDWRGRLPMGWNPNDTDFDTVGESGGAKSKLLTMANLPTAIPLQVGLYHENGNGYIAGGSDSYEGTSNTINFINTGGGQSISLLNPYRVVMFIEYVGV